MRLGTGTIGTLREVDAEWLEKLMACGVSLKMASAKRREDGSVRCLVVVHGIGTALRI